MQSPKKTGSVFIRCAVEDEAPIKKMVYEYLYMKDDTNKVIYNFMLENPSMPLKSIAYQLKKQHGIRIRKSALETMALNCALPYTK